MRLLRIPPGGNQSDSIFWALIHPKNGLASSDVDNSQICLRALVSATKKLQML
jgi:hypothetical protein